MPCYHPLKGYRSKEINPSGKRSIVFNARQGFTDMPVDLPCGQCIGCRLERSRQWAVRCVHEASLYEDNCFITLTYSTENLPKDNTLVLEHFQNFMKRLRKKYEHKLIRFFHCGEYGENFGRPHYHACIFNLDFKDKVLFSVVNENNIYISEELNELWPFGFSTIGNVTFDSAAYVARYITKKVTGENAFDHYHEVDYSTGEVLSERRPEYVTMSRRPGIGKGWFEKFKSDVFPHDFVVVNNKKITPPKYYAGQYEICDKEGFDLVKARRLLNAKNNSENNSSERLLVREEIKKYKFKELKRSYENET